MTQVELPLKMPGLSSDIQWKRLLGDAIKTEYRCAECTKPIDSVGFCKKCSQSINTLNKRKIKR